MTEWCSSVKPCWLGTDFRFKDIESCGGKISTQQFTLAALVVGAVFFVFLGLAKFGVLNSRAATILCSGLGAVNVVMVAVILLAKWERRHETLVDKVASKVNRAVSMFVDKLEDL